MKFSFTRRSRQVNAPDGADVKLPSVQLGRGDIAASIAWGGGTAAPAALVAAARDALDRGDRERALEFVRRARDRNDDFANAVPGMTGRKSLREAIYHPTLHAVLIDALQQCAATGVIKGQQIANVALEEWRWIGRDFPKLYGSGDEAYWHLFLSDYLCLYAMAFASGFSPSDAEGHEVDGGIAKAMADYAASVQAGSLTELGEQAKARIFALVGWPPPPRSLSFVARPTRASDMPCGSLITQVEIADWLEHDRDEPSIDVAEGTLPVYEPSRRRAPLPPGADLETLRELSLDQVGRAQSHPDAWWAAVDFGLYRWEMVRHYDEETTQWVRNLVHDLYATKARGDAPDTPLWDWQNLIDLFRYCLSRVEALLSAIDPARPHDRRSAQGDRNCFAWSAYECMRADGQTAAWNSFEPQLYAVLNESHPHELTPAQAGMLPALRRKYGSRDLHA